MNIKDIAALMTGGRSVADIKELAELEKKTPEVIEMAKAGTSIKDIKDMIDLANIGQEDPKEPKAEQGESDPTPPDQNIDYAAMYEESKKKVDELEATVKQIQKDNAAQNLAGKVKTLEETLQGFIDTVS